MIDGVKALGLPLFISDSNSDDGTLDAARGAGVPVFQREGQGKGFGVQTAVRAAEQLGHDVVVLIDCDCSYPVQDIPAVLAKMEEVQADMVVGCRPFANICLSHRLVNVFHTGAINLLYGSAYHDINSGLRALRIGRFRGILKAPGFDIEAEMSCLAAKYKMKVAEVPCGYEKRVGESKIRAWDTFVILGRILRERLP